MPDLPQPAIDAARRLLEADALDRLLGPGETAVEHLLARELARFHAEQLRALAERRVALTAGCPKGDPGIAFYQAQADMLRQEAERWS